MRKLILFLVALSTLVLRAQDYSQLYLVGDATSAGWNLDQAIRMTPVKGLDAVFTWTGHLSEGQFKFLNNRKTWTPCLNALSDNESVEAGQTRPLVYNDNTTWDYKFYNHNAGTYHVRVDMKSLQMSFGRTDNDNLQLQAVGTAVDDSGVVVVGDIYESTTAFRCMGKFNIGELKFKLSDGRYVVPASAEDTSIDAVSAIRLTNDATVKGWTVGRSGYYKMQFDVAYLTCSAKSYSLPAHLYLIGGASEAGWDLSQAIALEQDEGQPNVFVFQGELRNRRSHDEGASFKFVGQNTDWGSVSYSLHPLTNGQPIVAPTNRVTDVVEIDADLSINLSTDKACYSPGATVRFSAEGQIPRGAVVRNSYKGRAIDEHPLQTNSWEWTAPSDDFRGYMVDVRIKSNDKKSIVIGTIGVDVSSDWTRFPRYGFVATFGQEKLATGVIEKEMAYLNRCHINGVQFQDWHNKHHWPLGGTRDHLEPVYKDIANRDVHTDVVKKYIDVQHGYGMKAMFYNLCFGALSDAAQDGVKEEWYIFKDSNHTQKDYHPLDPSWKSSIYLVDPSNNEWQDYLGDRNDDVYHNFDFDGYQIDQLGSRGNIYDYNGKTVDLTERYPSFIEAMKNRHPGKRLVMNAVSSFGAKGIAGTGKVDFLYNELWDSEDQFSSLYDVIRANDLYSNNTLRTVFAAYMNYKLSDREFNTPGVLLTDAVMFALGGSHLELGDHMLCREYFPYAGVSMSEELKTAMVSYYDFMTAYQNLLRDGGEVNEVELTCLNCPMNLWPPRLNSVTTFSKKVGDTQIVHLLNFLSADRLSWRDMEGTMPQPEQRQNLSVQLQADRKINRIWVASPDFKGGVEQDLPFEQVDGTVLFTVPSLKYWTMIVIE